MRSREDMYQKGVNLTEPYRLLFEELEKSVYRTYSVYDYFIKEKKPPQDKKNVILRIDVDLGLHLCIPLAVILKERNINASFYFLTFPNRYYNIWKSNVPKIVSDMGFEVGLHTDHYYEQLVSGRDAIIGIKEDVKKLSNLIKRPIYGMVYHGHEKIRAFGKTNRDVYRCLKPRELGLVYHDGFFSPYTKSDLRLWGEPNTTHSVLTDFILVAGAWKYCPRYPVKTLKKVKLGESILICMHPRNVFNYQENWSYSYGEKMPRQEPRIKSLINSWKVKSALLVLRCLETHPKAYYLLRRVKTWIERLI